MYLGIKIGDTINWIIRPEVHKDFGGYLDTPRERGKVIAIRNGVFSVDTGRPISGLDYGTGQIVHDTFKICVPRSNPSIRREE